MNDLINAISTVGFPIVLTLVLIFQNNNKMDKAIETIADNTKEIALLVQEIGNLHLENFERKD